MTSTTMLRYFLTKTLEELDKLERAGDVPADDDSEGDFLDLPDAAEALGVSQALLRAWCRDRGIGRKPYGRWQVEMNRARQLLGR